MSTAAGRAQPALPRRSDTICPPLRPPASHTAAPPAAERHRAAPRPAPAADSPPLSIPHPCSHSGTAGPAAPGPARPTGAEHPGNPTKGPPAPPSYFRTRHFRFRRGHTLYTPLPSEERGVGVVTPRGRGCSAHERGHTQGRDCSASEGRGRGLGACPAWSPPRPPGARVMAAAAEAAEAGGVYAGRRLPPHSPSGLVLQTVEMHTGGEPLRIIPRLEAAEEAAESGGLSLLSLRREVAATQDHVRRALVHEPRGHAGMYGAVVVRGGAAAAGAHLAALFLHGAGYSAMCGHAVLALGRFALDYGLVAEPSSPETAVRLRCPCGPVTAFVPWDGRRSGNPVRFHSVPAFAAATGGNRARRNGFWGWGGGGGWWWPCCGFGGLAVWLMGVWQIPPQFRCSSEATRDGIRCHMLLSGMGALKSLSPPLVHGWVPSLCVRAHDSAWFPLLTDLPFPAQTWPSTSLVTGRWWSTSATVALSTPSSAPSSWALTCAPQRPENSSMRRAW